MLNILKCAHTVVIACSAAAISVSVHDACEVCLLDSHKHADRQESAHGLPNKTCALERREHVASRPGVVAVAVAGDKLRVSLLPPYMFALLNASECNFARALPRSTICMAALSLSTLYPTSHDKRHAEQRVFVFVSAYLCTMFGQVLVVLVVVKICKWQP